MLQSTLKLSLIAVIALTATIADAGNPPAKPGGATNRPGRPTPADPFGGLDPDVAAAMQMRALQARGRSGVQTGVPNPIITAGPQFQPMYSPLPATTGSAKSKNKSAAEKRAEARQLKEEHKRLARERAEKKAASKREAKQKKAPANKPAAGDAVPRE